ncbi:MAG: formate dehydrogenase subunit delta [Caulobacteraceae bacterium]
MNKSHRIDGAPATSHCSDETVRKLIHTANQTGLFFAVQRGSATAAMADHLRAFWAPTIRNALIDYVAGGGAELGPVPTGALHLLAVSGDGSNIGEAGTELQR